MTTSTLHSVPSKYSLRIVSLAIGFSLVFFAAPYFAVAQLSSSQSYATPGTYTFTVPTGVTNISADIWGAGGEGYSSYYGYFGGSGGYAGGAINVTPGEQLTIAVGGINGTDGGGISYQTIQGVSVQTGGGGFSGIFKGSITQTSALLIAGGGGGGEMADDGTSAGGAGGGASGETPQDGFTSAQYVGGGGTQAGGGAGGTENGCGYGAAGSALQGGSAYAPGDCYNAPGGGGGGWYGGGGGVGGGGGGSGYCAGSVSDCQLTTGSSVPENSQGTGWSSPSPIPPGNSGASDRPTGAGEGGAGNGAVVITWTTPPPACSVSISPNPSAYAYSGTPVTVSWSSANATQVYIDNIGWVGTSGSAQVASQGTTSYACYGYNSSTGATGSWNNGSGTTLTVTPPPSPTATIAASSTSIKTNQSTNLTAAFTAGSGDALTADNIDSPVGTGLGADTDPDPSKAITFSTTTPGTYTFYARATTDYYTSWLTLASTTVTVTQAPSCTPSTQYICTGANDDTITASSTSEYCNNTQTTVTTCSSPEFCQSGSEACLAPAISFDQNGHYSGQLQVTPDLVQFRQTTQVHWNVADARSCSVTATNGDSWTGLSSPADGETSAPITAQTTYTLFCEAYGSNPNLTETQSVNVTPAYEEI